MKIFNWIQTKINGKQSTYKSNPVAVTHHMLHQSCKEEFNDWPNELLAIGTFGSLKDCGKLKQQEQSLIVEEVGQLHKELKHLFPDDEESSSPLSTKLGSKKDLDKFFDCLQNLVDDDNDDDHRVVEIKENIFERCNSLVHKGQQSAQLEYTNSTNISKKSLSYLIKKTLFCSAGFVAPPTHPLRDPVLVPQSKIEKSRMEKILRAILHKKIYPQASSPRGTSTRKRYLDNTCVIESDSEDEAFESTVKNGSKWDKSDSDFIVLEI